MSRPEENRPARRQVGEMSVEPVAYAAGLRDYAGSTLDSRSLHSWMVQRVMLDLDLAHARATVVVDTVLAQPLPAPRRHARIRPRLTLHRA